MIVVDSSAVVTFLTDASELGKDVRRVMSADPTWCAPQHWSSEVFSAVRGLELGGHLDSETATVTIGRLARLAVESVALPPLFGAMWAMRRNVSGYDAAYVALAAGRRLTLVTTDGPLARAAVDHCRVELITARESR